MALVAIVGGSSLRVCKSHCGDSVCSNVSSFHVALGNDA